MATPESASASSTLNQRQQSRSAKLAPKAGGGNQSLSPVLPPLYPFAPQPSALNPEVVNKVKVYNNLCEYYRSNFSMGHAPTWKEGIYVERYSDRNKSPLAVPEHLLHMLPDSRFPDELTSKRVPHKTVTRKVKRKIEDLPDMDEALAEKDAAIIIKQEPILEDEDEDKVDVNVEDMDEYEDNIDEEMDVGTDYAMSYFDNGEGEDNDRVEDEGATY